MRDIEMKFDKNEFALLARLLFIGSVVAEGGLSDEDNEKADDLLDRVLQTAHSSKIIDGIEYDGELKRYFTDEETEEFLLEPYEIFVENSFWGELIARMAQNELIRKIGKKAYDDLSIEEKIESEAKLEDTYVSEFEEHGLENLTIKK